MSTPASPFKFLNAYQKGDHEVFFGRGDEAEALYDALSGVKHLMVYGPSGAGKTSLIECGLRNQFSEADWYALTIRRGDHIIRSVYESMNASLYDKVDIDADTGLPVDQKLSFEVVAKKLFSERFQPIYLLFDQFEELLLLGDKEEKEDFFKRLDDLIQFQLPVRVLLILREEFIGHLSEFEHLCPSIFQYRYRLEKMQRSTVGLVIKDILEAETYQEDFKVDAADELAKQILAKLPDQKKEIELTHVQVFLEELWDRAHEQKDQTGLPVLNTALLQAEDNLETVLDRFLKKQLEKLELPYGEKLPMEVLSCMISDQHTKLQVSADQLEAAIKENEVQLSVPIQQILEDLEQSSRIIRATNRDDNVIYEISHDLLAKAVGENQSEEIRLRDRANKVYKFYLDRKQLLSQNDLDHIRAFERYKSYPAPLARIIKESQDAIETERNKELKAQQRRTRIAILLLSIALAGLVGTLIFYQESEKRRQEKQEKVIDLLWENATRNKIDGQYQVANDTLRGLRREVQGDDFELNRIEDTIRAWTAVDSLVQLAAIAMDSFQYKKGVQSIELAYAKSPDQRLFEQLVQYKEKVYEVLIIEARGESGRKYREENIATILDLKIRTSRAEIIQDIEQE
ncbi:MAG: ATP-binding protein [Bacteroidota bacterium]